MIRFAGLLAVALAATACTGESVWTVEAEGLEPALLAVQPHDGDVFAVGGPLAGDGPPAIRQRRDGAWTEVAPPSGWRGAAWWAWSAGPDDVWVVGAFGQVARGPLDALELQATGTSTETVFYGVWGSGPDDVWLVGGSARAAGGPYGVLLRWDGAGFTEVTPSGDAAGALDNVLFKVWGTGPDHVVAVGALGMAIEYDGDGWTRTDTGVNASLTTVHGRAADDYYAVGGFNQGLVLRWDGAAWTSIGEDFAPPLSGVFVTDDAVWVAGESGYLASWDGAAWTAVDTLVPEAFHAVHVEGGDVYGVGGILTVSQDNRRGFIGRFGP